MLKQTLLITLLLIGPRHPDFKQFIWPLVIQVSHNIFIFTLDFTVTKQQQLEGSSPSNHHHYPPFFLIKTTINNHSGSNLQRIIK